MVSCIRADLYAGGISSTTHEIRLRIFILSTQKLIKKVIKICKLCMKFKGLLRKKFQVEESSEALYLLMQV